jgi:transposase
MQEVASEGTTAWHLALDNFLVELALRERQITQATERLDAIAELDERVHLLQTIVAVGRRTAEAIVAYTDDIHRFRDAKQYAAYFGLTPKLDESGSCRRLGHISKQGPSAVRWLLVECSWGVIGRSPSLRAYYHRVMHGQRNRKKIAVVAVARKLATIIYAMLKSGEVFNESLVAAQVATLG